MFERKKIIALSHIFLYIHRTFIEEIDAEFLVEFPMPYERNKHPSIVEISVFYWINFKVPCFTHFVKIECITVAVIVDSVGIYLQ